MQAVVLLSGGQDSTTCLAWAVKCWGSDQTVALSFDYGQRHSRELESARKIAEHFKVSHYISRVSLPYQSAMTDSGQIITEGGDNELPSTFLPGRNAVFLSVAGGLAKTLGASHIVTGICQTDYSGYPDCREEFREAMEKALKKALDIEDLQIHAPLMWLTKAQTVQMVQSLGCLDALALSHTCYEGVSPACGVCPACVLRLRGFAEAGIPDPLPYKKGKS